MTTRYFVDSTGHYIGGFDGSEPPGGAIEVPTPPDDARQIWHDAAWGPVPVDVPANVSSRQFKVQLDAMGLLDSVEAWIDTQPRAVRLAYDNSGYFVRTEPMMQTGFAALGFTKEQIDAFFTAAALL